MGNDFPDILAVFLCCIPSELDSLLATHAATDFLVFGLAHREIGLVPSIAERDAGMQGRQAEHRQDDHTTLEDHEGDFVVGETARESLLKFGHTEAGPHKYEDHGGHQTYDRICQSARFESSQMDEMELTEEESPEAERPAQSRICGVPLVLLVPRTPCEVGTQHHEDEQGEDLARQAGDHDVDSGLLGGFGAGGGSQGPSDGLQHQREQVEADEAEGVESRTEA